jgi:hypothetical protein
MAPFLSLVQSFWQPCLSTYQIDTGVMLFWGRIFKAECSPWLWPSCPCYKSGPWQVYCTRCSVVEYLAWRWRSSSYTQADGSYWWRRYSYQCHCYQTLRAMEQTCFLMLLLTHQSFLDSKIANENESCSFPPSKFVLWRAASQEQPCE